MRERGNSLEIPREFQGKSLEYSMVLPLTVAFVKQVVTYLLLVRNFISKAVFQGLFKRLFKGTMFISVSGTLRDSKDPYMSLSSSLNSRKQKG